MNHDSEEMKLLRKTFTGKAALARNQPCLYPVLSSQGYRNYAAVGVIVSSSLAPSSTTSRASLVHLLRLSWLGWKPLRQCGASKGEEGQSYEGGAFRGPIGRTQSHGSHHHHHHRRERNSFKSPREIARFFDPPPRGDLIEDSAEF